MTEKEVMKMEDFQARLYELLNESATHAQQLEDLRTNSDHFFLVVIAMLVFFMQCGFAFLEAGSVRSKNTVNILIKNTLDTLIGGVAYWALGWGLAYGDGGTDFMGQGEFFNIGIPEEKYPLWLFQFTFASVSSTIVSGAIAERCQFGAYIIYSILITAFIYPPVSHWAWDAGRIQTGNVTYTATGGGKGVWDATFNATFRLLNNQTLGNGSMVSLLKWDYQCTNENKTIDYHNITINDTEGQGNVSFEKYNVSYTEGMGWLYCTGNFHDFAGSGVVHLTGGVIALVSCCVIGARLGRFIENSVKPMPGHSVPLAALGGFILIFGFLAFNGGSLTQISGKGDGAHMAKIVLNTILGGCAGGLIVLFLNRLKDNTWSFLITLNGALTGMVALCAGCDLYEPYVALFCGAGGGLCYLATHFGMLWAQLDDPLDAVGVHGAGGLWGLMFAAFFPSPDLKLAIDLGYRFTWQDLGSQLTWQLAGAAAIIGWAALWSSVIFFPLKYMNMFRVSEDMERRGIDILKHGEAAYPATAWEEDQYGDGDTTYLLPNHMKAARTGNGRDHNFEAALTSVSAFCTRQRNLSSSSGLNPKINRAFEDGFEA